jgi:hypothetical protein
MPLLVRCDADDTARADERMPSVISVDSEPTSSIVSVISNAGSRNAAAVSGTCDCVQLNIPAAKVGCAATQVTSPIRLCVTRRFCSPPRAPPPTARSAPPPPPALPARAREEGDSRAS